MEKLINGYSGYTPPGYWIIAGQMQKFPDTGSIEIVRRLGVDCVILHKKRYRKDDPIWSRVEDFFGEGILARIYEDPTTVVYRVEGPVEKKLNPDNYTALRREGWQVWTNYNPEKVRYMIDNDKHTRWDSGTRQVPDMYVEIDLGKMEKFSCISMDLGRYTTDYPREIEIQISENGREWEKAEIISSYADFIESLIKNPLEATFTVKFHPVNGRYIKIIQKGEDDIYYWGICEINILCET